MPPGPTIDPRLGAIILKACALDPAQRYASAAELYEALTGFLSEGEAERAEGQVVSRRGHRVWCKEWAFQCDMKPRG